MRSNYARLFRANGLLILCLIALLWTNTHGQEAPACSSMNTFSFSKHVENTAVRDSFGSSLIGTQFDLHIKDGKTDTQRFHQPFKRQAIPVMKASGIPTPLVPSLGVSKWWFLIFSILIVGLLIALRNERKKNQFALEEINELQSELKTKREALFDAIQDNSNKEKILQEIKEKVATLSDGSPKSVEIKKINHLLSHLNPELEWQKFRKNFSEKYPSYLERLIQAYPKINETEKWLCAYIKLDFSNQKIADLMHVSRRTIESRKYRLKKKFRLEHEIDLVSYLKEL